ncbi:nucleotidyltransferase [Rhodopseudomonas palustris]|uniref:Nucleotidyltransferase n=1 Tax=Rhodopseudomonas palustris TaxID=1076 RepID=A0A323UH71_RHOPL|nr:nucleotidyltransferase family protein [Rhodopseudomonas palustris]PZA11914.1 nucleotidyltransferase [Rhodopseudomonas palustris]
MSQAANQLLKPSEALAEHGNRLAAILSEFGLTNPRLFGSVARGEDTRRSDLDILVDAVPTTSLYDFARAEQALETLLGCRVEIVTAGLLAPDVAARIQTDLVPLP